MNNTNIEAQFQIEKKYSKQNIREWMLREFAAADDSEFKYQVRELIELIGHECAVELLLVVLRTQFQSIQSVVSQLAGNFDGDNIFEKVDAATEMVVKVAKTIDIFNIVIKESVDETGEPHEVVYIRSNYDLGKEILQKISDTLYIPPMVCEPRKLYENTDSVYLTREDHVILKGVNQHDGYQALDALNIINAVPLALDLRMLFEDEAPKKPLNTIEKRENFERMVNSSKSVVQIILDNDNRFHLNHKYGKRGRMYEDSHHVGLQKNCYRKSQIRLADEEIIPLD
ncbi:MAG: hypothetical protein HRU18_02685 [Pseudoalteromonas sp.]|uniref:hypothetical protein n=1 Tax=Pseudoalteromonas sp. TaxID=53249 RepID=UPI001D4881B8|nr:hypothetical protein [Pseudoalteromonas sp.]NRA77090.1 hypothetical protein [Pseudoalteromonas sp.]